jgi:alpha-beta hydrolase superfamily lysophospholipase
VADPDDLYERAMTRFAIVEAREKELPLHRRCRSTLLTHGSRVEKAVVYFHGFTSCPAQGGLLARRFHDLGFNVYLPRMFGHGGLDPRRLSMAEFSVDKLIDLADESVDIAAGLGQQVLVVGLSAGGTIASWVAQNRLDVGQVIGISPFFAPFMLPQQAVKAASELLLKMPNLVIGWNPLANVAAEQIDYPFALPATHALAQIMVLGQQVRAAAKQDAPEANRIGFLLNAADRSVSNKVTHTLVESWQAHGKDVRVEVLPLEHRLPHDIINPFERGNDFERVYVTLLEMILRASS